MRGHIQRRGKNSWRLKFDTGRDLKTGKRVIHYVTVRGKRDDAEKELRKQLSQIDRGIIIEPTKMTVAEYLDTWLDDVAPDSVGPKALERYRGLVRNQIKPHLGAIRLQRLRPADIKAWHRELIDAGDISTRTIRHAHGVLRKALADAAAVETVERNVASIIKPPKVKDTEKKEMAILTDKEVPNTLQKLEGHSLYPIVAFAIGTGARRGEIAALRWSDIDLDGATARIERALEQTKEGIRVKPPKTNSGIRTLSLPVFTVVALREHRRGQLELRMAAGLGKLPADAPVFGNLEGDWPNPYSISDRWRDAVETRKLPKITFHGLRHTHASALIAAKLDIVNISRRLGHRSPAFTLSTYSHLFEDRDEEAAAAIDAVLSQGANRVPTPAT